MSSSANESSTSNSASGASPPAPSPGDTADAASAADVTQRGPSPGLGRAAFAALLLVATSALAFDELPGAPAAVLWRTHEALAAAAGVGASGAAGSGASATGDNAAEDENVRLWLKPGPGYPHGAAIVRGGGGNGSEEGAGGGGGADGAAPCGEGAVLGVRLTGGLGNHLFGAAFGVALSLRRAGRLDGLTLLRVDPTDLRYAEVHPLEQTIFARFAVSSVDLWNAQKQIQQIGATDWRHFCREYSPERVASWAAAPCGAAQLAEGYFQDAGFFGSESALIRRLFAVPEAVARDFRAQFPPPGSGGRNATAAGPRGGVPWAIHVRRGDYVAKAEWHHLLPLTYFAEGIFRMLAHLEAAAAGGGPVFVFSDDVAWVREQDVFRDLAGAVFVEERDPLRAFYMLALAAEGGVLCSNSTFCWWAAFLSELGRRRAVRRLVIFPDGWTATHSLTGFHGPGDCGGALRMPYMTVLDGFR